MLDFICELEKVMCKWPDDDVWTLAHLADQTMTGVPQVVDIVSEILEKEIEVHETINKVDGTKVLTALKERMHGQLLARKRRMEIRRDNAIKAYDQAMDRVRVLLMTKNWRSAYKTLTYYVGRYEADLPDDLMLTLCGECLRLGAKANSNMQEMSQWLKKGVSACIRGGTSEYTEEALDFIDAYSEHFIIDLGGRGRRLLNNMLSQLKDSVDTYNLTPQYNALVQGLGISYD
jgi:hypothetical protein